MLRNVWQTNFIRGIGKEGTISGPYKPEAHLFVPQVREFGCTSFSLLFDDIETEMCPADKEAFGSFAHAQVAVTNAVYQHLGEPETFLFCPTGEFAQNGSRQNAAVLSVKCLLRSASWSDDKPRVSSSVTPDYCAAFCTPTVSQSSYLRTVGEKLLPGVDILWTGKISLSQDLIDPPVHVFEHHRRREKNLFSFLHVIQVPKWCLTKSLWSQ